MEEEEIDPEPLVPDTQPPLAANEREVAAELQQEALEVVDQGGFQLGLAVLVAQPEELQDERVLDGFLCEDFVRALFAGTVPPESGVVSRQAVRS